MALAHTLMILLLLGPIALGLYSYARSRKVPTSAKTGLPKERSAFPLVVNSAILSALAYNLIFFIQELFLTLGKRWLGLKAFLYHNNHSWEGSHPMTALAQGYGALAIFIAGWIFLGLFLLRGRSKRWIRLFFLWMSFWGFLQSLPQVFTAKMDPGTDVGQALAYLKASNEVLTILVVVSTLAIITVALFFSRLFLSFAEVPNQISHPRDRFAYLLKIGLLAAFLGAILIIPFRLPPLHQAMGPFILAIVSLPWVFANAWRVENIQTIGSEVNERILIVPMGLLLILLGVFQGILARGIVF